MSLFDKEKDKMLIKLVRDKPVIYDRSHPQHRNLIAKHEEWKKISTAMDIPIADIQKRWKHFRDHYKKKKKLKSKKNTWRYMHLLEFLSAPLKISQSDNRRWVEEQSEALSQEPQTADLDKSLLSYIQVLRHRYDTLLPETGLTNNKPEPISLINRRPEDIQIPAGPSTSSHYDNIQKKREPLRIESSLSLEALRKRLITTDVREPISSDEIPKEDQNSSNSDKEEIYDSDISIFGRRTYYSPIHRYFEFVLEIALMLPPHLVSDLKLRIHKSIYQIELEWQNEKRGKGERERKEREREERKNTNRLIAFNYRQLNLSRTSD